MTFCSFSVFLLHSPADLVPSIIKISPLNVLDSYRCPIRPPPAYSPVTWRNKCVAPFRHQKWTWQNIPQTTNGNQSILTRLTPIPRIKRMIGWESDILALKVLFQSASGFLSAHSFWAMSGYYHGLVGPSGGSYGCSTDEEGTSWLNFSAYRFSTATEMLYVILVSL